MTKGKSTRFNPCRTCEFYTYEYGLGGKDGYGSYKSCDFKKALSDKCKRDNFKLFKRREDEKDIKN